MKYKLADYYKDGYVTPQPDPFWRKAILFPFVFLMWLTNYPPTRGQ